MKRAAPVPRPEPVPPVPDVDVMGKAPSGVAEQLVILWRTVQNLARVIGQMGRNQVDAFATQNDLVVSSDDPATVLVGGTADPGASTDAMRADAQLVVARAVPSNPVQIGGTAAAGSSTSALAADAQLVVTAAAPTNATGAAAAAGAATTGLRSDCTIKQGIVTTKGDLLGFGSTPDRLAIGADDTVLVAKASQSLGAYWRSAAQWLFTFLTSKGDIAVSTGATAQRKAVGSNYTLLEADSAQADGLNWTALAAILARLLTTKGDLAVSNGSTVVREAVGASDYMLQEVKASTSTGRQWSTFATILGREFANKGEVLAGSAANTVTVVPRAADPDGGYTGGGYPQILRYDNSYTGGVGADWPWHPYIFPPALTNNVASDLIYLPVAVAQAANGFLRYNIYVNDGTNTQAETGMVRWETCRNNAGTWAAAPTAPVVVSSGQALSSGTLAVTWTWNQDSGNNRLILQVKSNSSLTPTTHYIQWEFLDLAWSGEATFPYSL